MSLPLDQRQVCHEPVGCGTVPVVLAGLEEHAVSGSDHLNGPAPALAEPVTLGHVDVLAQGVGVPGGAGAGGEVDAGGLQPGWR